MDKLAIGICSGSIGSFISTLCARIDTPLWQLSLVKACVVTRSLSVLPRQLDIAELHPPSATASAECGIPHISGVPVLLRHDGPTERVRGGPSTIVSGLV